METELYTEVAEILRKAQEKRATLKTLIYGSKYKNIRQLFALVIECNRHRDIIEEVLSQCSSSCSIIDDLAEGSTEMALVLLYEYLLGNKFGRTVSLRKLIQTYKQDITRSVEKVLQKHQAKTLSEASQKISHRMLTQIPRYMRVNLIKSSVEDVVEKLIHEGWNYVGKIDNEKFSDDVKYLQKWQFGLDPLLFDLLVFPIGTDFHDHPLTRSGVLVQQDRASCVPAHVLNPPKGTVVLDSCSAPGNKTSHLASLISNTGRVIALDRDNKRMLTMSRLLEKSAATCVEMIVQDFLTVQSDSDDAQDVQYILVDPSCSGSGMLGSRTETSDCSSQRLLTLQRFQISILKHALHFPNVKRVVYSTCSVHPEENEQVVEEVMSQFSQNFQFHPVFPEWKCSRGLDGYPHSKFFLRLSPDRDLTQGFFVACFERLEQELVASSEINEYTEQLEQVQSSRQLQSSSDNKKVKSDRIKKWKSGKEKKKKCKKQTKRKSENIDQQEESGNHTDISLPSGKKRKEKHT